MHTATAIDEIDTDAEPECICLARDASECVCHMPGMQSERARRERDDY